MAPSILQSLDKQLEQLFAGWNGYSTALAVAVLVLLFAPLFTSSEPDVHPFLLARQAAASPVRQPGESAVYRSLETPHGYPLRTGLNIKDEGAPRWATGRDGDLRDIWREALRNKPARFIKLLGKLKPVHYELKALCKDINVIGERLQREGGSGSRVALYLPNSMELLVALFACAFYGLTPILIAQGQPIDLLKKLLSETKADTMVASAGTISPEDVLDKSSKLKHLILVVEESSRHMDFGEDSNKKLSVWHDLVTASKADGELPTGTADEVPPGVVQVWQGTTLEKYEIVEHSQRNLAAAVSSQLTCLPRLQRLGPTDTVLSLVPLASSYPLVVTLAALHSHATIALTSSAAADAQYNLVFQNASVPVTVLIASPGTLTAYLASSALHSSDSIFTKGRNAYRARRLAAGIMPFANRAPGSSASHSPASSTPVSPRLIYTPFPAPLHLTDATPPLTPSDLGELRIRTGARIVHALTVPPVAGAVAQSHALDYRLAPAGAARAHFGAPLSCVELRVRQSQSASGTDAGRRQGEGSARVETGWIGRLVVGGPAVAVTSEKKVADVQGQDGEMEIPVKVRFGPDGTVSLV